MDLLQQWESQIALWENQSGERLSEQIQIATVMRHAREDIKQVLRMTSRGFAKQYVMLRAALEEYLATGRQYDGYGLSCGGASSSYSGPAPMEVGAIRDKSGGSKGKHYDRKGGKDNYSGKGKSKHKGKGKGQSNEQGPQGHGRQAGSRQGTLSFL